MKSDKDLPTIGRSLYEKNSLLSVQDLSRITFALLKESQEKHQEWETQNRIYELRKSCGAPNPPIKIRVGVPFDERLT